MTLAKAPLAAAPLRSFHVTRAVLAEAAPTYKYPLNPGSKYVAPKNTHVLEAASITTWQEMPVGGIHRGGNMFKKIWYNDAVVPIFAVIAVAAGLCGFFMYRYFTANVEIAWSKSVRATYDHTGFGSRADKHDNRLLYPGMRDRNKRPVSMYPFNFIPMQSIVEKRLIDYNNPDREE
jgi:hypothetical protein